MAVGNVFGEGPGQGTRGQYKNSEQPFLNISISTDYEEKEIRSQRLITVCV